MGKLEGRHWHNSKWGGLNRGLWPWADSAFPAVCIRTSTERPEALDKACFILSGIGREGLLQSVDLAVSMNAGGDHGIPVPDYADTDVSTKVVKIIQSYKDTVNRFVWRKEMNME